MADCVLEPWIIMPLKAVYSFTRMPTWSRRGRPGWMEARAQLLLVTLPGFTCRFPVMGPSGASVFLICEMGLSAFLLHRVIRRIKED